MWNLLQNCNTAQLSSRSKRLCCSQSWLPPPSFRFRVACWPRGREWKRGRPRAAEGRKAGTSGSTEDGVWGRGASCWGHGAEPWGPEAASPLLPPRGPRLNFSASWPPGRGTREVGLFFFPFFSLKSAGGADKSLRSVSFPYRGCRRRGKEGGRSWATLPVF